MEHDTPHRPRGAVRGRPREARRASEWGRAGEGSQNPTLLPDRKEGLLIEGICRPIPWDKVLNVASPDGGVHACWQSFGHPPAVRCVILPGETRGMQLVFVGNVGRARQLLPYLGKLCRTHLPFLLR